MKEKFFICAILALFILGGTEAFGQMPKVRITGTPMFYEVVDGDTVFVDVIRESRITSRGKRGGKTDWRKYYKTVYHFNKVYPYALLGRDLMAQVDSTIAADVTRKSQRKKYIDAVEKELLRTFEDDIRHMTITQGMILLKLVDRECGMSGYDIIKTYESKFAAGFWQLVARVFSHDLKTHYNPKGADWQLEELVYIWDSGQWDTFYASIFGEYPPKTELKKRSLESVVKK